MSTRRRALMRVAIAAFVVVVIGFFALALVRAWDQTDGELPSAPRLGVAGGLWICGLLAGAFSWATLLGGDHRIDHGAAFLVAQLGKYVPGGVWQATGQVGLARSAGVRLQRGATAFSVLAVIQVTAGCNWALLLAAVWTEAATVLRVLLAAGALASLTLIDRRWMVWVLGKIPRARDASGELVPGQRSILRSWLASLAALGATSTAYLVILGSFGRVDRPWLVIAAYAAAWTVGFVALPIPAGVGVREVVLATILHGLFPPSVIVAASVYHRLTSIAAEGVLATGAAHRLRPSRLRGAVSAEDSGAPNGAPRPESR